MPAVGCIYTYKRVQYTEQEFKQLLMSGELNDLLPSGISEQLDNLKNNNDATKIRQQPKNNKQQREGTAKQQQGEQADRADKEENDTGGEKETGRSNLSQQGREEKIAELEKEKQQKINEVTKPDVDFYMGIDNVDLANTTAQNRHDLLDIKSRLQSLNQIIKCLWS